MLIDLIKTAWKPLILIAVVSLAVTTAFNLPNLLITTEYINGVKISHFNLQTYLNSISNAWESNALNFEDILPDREWEEITSSFVESQFWEAIGNNIALLFDYVYFPINFILWVLRWICWLVKILLTIIGWPTMMNTNGTYDSVLTTILVWIIQNLQIPYL